jgi:hypothetical protein
LNEFHPNELDPFLLFDARDSMIGTLENPTLDLDPSKPDTLNVITATRAGTATYTDVNGNIATASADTVRVDHVDGVPMILVEPSATNLLSYSEEFGQWNENTNGNGVSPVITSDQEIAPNGLQEADKIVFNLGGGTSTGDEVSLSLSPSLSGQPYAGSIYLKGENGGEVILLRTVTGGYTELTLTTEWQRFESIETYVSGTRRFEIGLRGGIVSGGINNTATIYAWGAQLETGSVSTSYIPTSGGDAAARTRAADDLVISGSDFDFYNQSEGTTYVETVPKTTTNLPHIFEYHNSSDANANRIGVYLPNVSLNLYVRSSGTTTVSSFLGNINLNQLNRLAASYKVNDVLGSLNGEPEVADTSAAIPSGIDKMHIGNVYNFNFPLNGHIKRLIYWPYHSDSL